MKKSRAIEDLEKIVVSWKESYARIIKEEGGGEFLWKDFREEIEEYALPYVQRMRHVCEIDDDQYDAFVQFCYGQVSEIIKLVSEEENYA